MVPKITLSQQGLRKDFTELTKPLTGRYHMSMVTSSLNQDYGLILTCRTALDYDGFLKVMISLKAKEAGRPSSLPRSVALDKVSLRIELNKTANSCFWPLEHGYFQDIGAKSHII